MATADVASDGIIYWFPAPSGPDALDPPAHSRQWLLMKALSHHVPVLVATPYRQPPTRTLPRLTRVRMSPTLTVLLGAFSASQVRRLGPARSRVADVDALRIRAAAAATGIRHPLYWAATSEPLYLRRPLSSKLVYDCIDPALTTSGREQHQRRERAMARRAHLVFATAAALEEHMRMLHPRVVRLPNACEPRTPAPVDFGGSRDLGFMGTLDERIDWEFLARCAAAMPDRTLHLIGRVNASETRSLSLLEAAHHNVRVHGPLPALEGSDRARALGVALIPYRTGYVGDSINPVKLYMHAQDDVPVVSPPLRELAAVGPPMAFVAPAGEEARALSAALASSQNPADRELRLAFATQNTWDVRAETAVRALRAIGLLAH